MGGWIVRWMGGQYGGWVDSTVDGWTVRWMGGQYGGWVDSTVGGWIVGWVGGRVKLYLINELFCKNFYVF